MMMITPTNRHADGTSDDDDDGGGGGKPPCLRHVWWWWWWWWWWWCCQQTAVPTAHIMVTMTNRYDCGTYDGVCVWGGGGGEWGGVCACVFFWEYVSERTRMCAWLRVCVCTAYWCVQLTVILENFSLQLMPHDRQMVLHPVLLLGYPACCPL